MWRICLRAISWAFRHSPDPCRALHITGSKIVGTCCHPNYPIIPNSSPPVISVISVKYHPVPTKSHHPPAPWQGSGDNKGLSEKMDAEEKEQILDALKDGTGPQWTPVDLGGVAVGLGGANGWGPFFKGIFLGIPQYTWSVVLIRSSFLRSG